MKRTLLAASVFLGIAGCEAPSEETKTPPKAPTSLEAKMRCAEIVREKLGQTTPDHLTDPLDPEGIKVRAQVTAEMQADCEAFHQRTGRYTLLPE